MQSEIFSTISLSDGINWRSIFEYKECVGICTATCTSQGIGSWTLVDEDSCIEMLTIKGTRYALLVGLVGCLIWVNLLYKLLLHLMIV